MKNFLSFFLFCLCTYYASSQETSLVRIGGIRPQWIDNPYSIYGKEEFITAVGQGENIDWAMYNAMSSLVGFFGRRIIQIDDDNYIFENAYDHIIGAEITAIWDDAKGTVYALATVNKDTLIDDYTTFAIKDSIIIDDLITMSDEEKNSFNGYARLMEASCVAEDINNYLNILKQAGQTWHTLENVDKYRNEARAILNNIPIQIICENDRYGRIQGAFTKVFSDRGFRTVRNNARYVLSVHFNALPGFNYTLLANLIDRTENDIILYYNTFAKGINENDAISVLEFNISQGFGQEFEDLLISYIPEY